MKSTKKLNTNSNRNSVYLNDDEHELSSTFLALYMNRIVLRHEKQRLYCCYENIMKCMPQTTELELERIKCDALLSNAVLDYNNQVLKIREEERATRKQQLKRQINRSLTPSYSNQFQFSGFILSLR